MQTVIFPDGSRRSIVARSLAVVFVLALSVCTQTVAIVNFPGTNGYYGMVGYYGTAAYSLIEDHTLTGRAGDLVAIKTFVLRSDLLTNDYVQLEDLRPALRETKPGDVLFYYPPGYSLYLAATFLATGNYGYATARAVQELLNIIGVPVLLILTGRLLRHFPAGLGAAALFALFTGPAQQTFFILPDGLMTFFATLVLATSVWATLRDRPGAYAVLGVVLGVAANLRSDFLGVAIFLALGIWVKRGRLNLATLSRIGIVGAVAFLLLVPYGLIQRNFQPISRFQITSPAMGQSLWEAYGETPNPHGAVLSDAAVDQLLAKAGKHIHLPDGEAYLKKIWLQAAVREPRWFAWSVYNRSQKVIDYWRTGVRPPFVPAADSSAGQRFLIRLTNAALQRFSMLVIFCGLFAIVFSRAGLLVAAAPLSYLIAFSFLHVEQRYVTPALGPLAFAGCYGAALLLERVSDGLRKLRSRVEAKVADSGVARNDG